jgi:hypothetical protein
MKRVLLVIISFVMASAETGRAVEMLDLTGAVVVTAPNRTGVEQKAVQMLIEEVEKRTHVRWEVEHAEMPRDKPVIMVGTADEFRRRRGPTEGYDVSSSTTAGLPTVRVVGHDARGLLFGVGRLLRELRMERGKVTLPADFKEASAPQTPLRGHQIGYRPKTNSYDGWTVAMWEQYLRDLVVFGGNAIELIPPRSDDAPDSPLFPLPPKRMLVEVSRLAAAYGMDVWLWYPAMDRNYADPATVEFALKEWGEIFKAMPRLDAVFVPGGDPGHTQPKVLFALLEKQTANLHRYHPGAQMWVSPQSFNQAWLDEFFELMQQEPAWLHGVVYGPQVRIPLAECRKRLPKRYPLRDYPDITHSRHCQYPVPDWDLAFAITEGREVCNPRPTQMARIYWLARPHTSGFITYSEGCHDDVNKTVWSALGWNKATDIREVLRQYARYFVGPAFEDRFADGLLALEKNWQGPVLANQGIDATLKAFQETERTAGPSVKLSWRFQQALYRAYYDAYVRARCRYETDLETAALERLRAARSVGAVQALSEAEAQLDRAVKEPVARELRARVFELAEALFQSIRAQLSVPRYHAIALERGANLDAIDLPLNSVRWLKQQFAEIRALGDEAARLARIDAIVNRTDPGPDGFYDALGDPTRRPHLVRGLGWTDDPAFFTTPLTGFTFRGTGPATPMPTAWWRHAEALYDAPLSVRYTGLDKTAAYRVRVVYAVERPTMRVRLRANDRFEIHDYLSRPFQPLEFDVPREATAGGELTLTWNQPPGAGGAGRGCQVAEVWLLKPGAK